MNKLGVQVGLAVLAVWGIDSGVRSVSLNEKMVENEWMIEDSEVQNQTQCVWTELMKNGWKREHWDKIPSGELGVAQEACKGKKIIRYGSV